MKLITPSTVDAILSKKLLLSFECIMRYAMVTDRLSKYQLISSIEEASHGKIMVLDLKAENRVKNSNW